LTGPCPRPRLNLAALVVALMALAMALPAIAAAAPEVTLEVNITGSGEGGLGCKVNGGPLEECEAEYPEGTEVALFPEAEFGSEFTGWSGACTGTGACELTLNEGKSVTATFEIEEFEVTVETEGNGEGVVECQVEGGPYELCPESETYPYGTELILFAENEPRSEFIEWSGDCSGVEGECELTVEEPLSVFATFAQEPPFDFAIAITGSGSGEVSCEVEGQIEECETEYEEGIEVVLIPEAAEGSEFIEWSGDCTGSGPCELTMDEGKSVTATFDLIEFALVVKTAGTGSGTVECEVEGGPAEPCEAEYPEGTEVALVPEAKIGSEFAGWSGDCTGTGSCELTMDEGKSVTATFALEPPSEFALTVSLGGSGSGTVTSSPGSINCGIVCSGAFAAGAEIALTATPASGSTFAGWSGDCTGTGACKITMSQTRSVTATFEKAPTPPPSAGTAVVARTAKVKGGKAQLKLTCKGEGPCKGSLKLTAKIKSGAKTKSLTIGKASFSLGAGASKTLKVKLSGPAKQALAKGKTLKAKAGGTGVAASTVKLKPAS
jgi:Divergent InlB B-repeat domain